MIGCEQMNKDKNSKTTQTVIPIWYGWVYEQSPTDEYSNRFKFEKLRIHHK